MKALINLIFQGFLIQPILEQKLILNEFLSTQNAI